MSSSMEGYDGHSVRSRGVRLCNVHRFVYLQISEENE